MKISTIEHQYQFYLKLAGLNEAEMHPQQKLQVKETFFAACGQMLALLRDEIAPLGEDKAVLNNEVLTYWEKKAK